MASGDSTAPVVEDQDQQDQKVSITCSFVFHTCHTLKRQKLSIEIESNKYN